MQHPHVRGPGNQCFTQGRTVAGVGALSSNLTTGQEEERQPLGVGARFRRCSQAAFAFAALCCSGNGPAPAARVHSPNPPPQKRSLRYSEPNHFSQMRS